MLFAVENLKYMIHNKPATCISVYKNVFSKNDAKVFIEALNKNIEEGWSELNWENSGTGNGMVSNYRTSLICSAIPLMKPYPETQLSKLFNETIVDPVKKVCEDYREEYMIQTGFHEAYQILKYFPGAEYHAHADHGKLNGRVYSMVATLGEPEEGGSLEFPFFDVSVECEVGNVILFPSNFPYTHIAHPVVKGVKYSLVTWYS